MLRLFSHKMVKRQSMNFSKHSFLQEKLILKYGLESGIPTMTAIDAMLGGIDTTGQFFLSFGC
jgi:hypothetical protein